MKRVATALFCVAAFLLIAAPIYVESQTYPVMINGTKFANAVNIDGVIAISVEDLAKALGGPGATLSQAGLKLRGNTLSVENPTTVGATGGAGAGKIRFNEFVIKKTSDVSSAVFRKAGKAFVPLVDVARAFGGIFNPANVHPGDTIALNFTNNPDAALAVAPRH